MFIQKTDEVLDSLSNQSIVENSHTICQNFTLDVLGKAIFGFDFMAVKGETRKELQAYQTVMEKISNPLYLLLFPLTWIPSLPYNKLMSSSIDAMFDLYDRLIKESKERMAQSKQPTCMLDFMVKWMEDGQGMTRDMLRSNVSVFFIAGHETTANALAFAIYALAKHTDVQDKVRKEVDELLGDEKPTVENLKKLDYLYMVIQETLRMYCPVGNTTPRITDKNVQIGDWKIPKGVSESVSFTNL